MQTGQFLGNLARQLFPTGSMVKSFSSDNEAALIETRQLIESGATVLFEAAFATDKFLVRCDILERAGDGWHLIEVKSSTRVKEDHLEDVAFQVFVLEAVGLVVNRASICLVDNTKERGDSDLAPIELLKIEDISTEVRKLVPEVEGRANQLYDVLCMSEAPIVETNLQCEKPNLCPYYDYCHVGQSENDVINLPGIRAREVIRFREQGILTIDQIPENTKLSVHQKRALETIRFHLPFVGSGLSSKLSEISFPAEFIDFEAAGPAIPLFPGMRPYQSFPFQWSSHRMSDFDQDAQHFGFIHNAEGDPRPAFARSLFEQIQNASTILFYSNYEQSTVNALAESGIEYGKELQTLLKERGFDLLKLIREEVYHEEFKGSFSIKKVLPALVPSLNYDNLEIKDGDSAAVEYMRIFSPGTMPSERDRIIANLEAYCELDTFAMYKLYLALRDLAGP